MRAEIVKISSETPETSLVKYAADQIRSGEVLGMPTDTFYGLAADPFNLRAVDKVYDIKTRSRHKPLSLLIESTDQAEELAAARGVPFSPHLRIPDDQLIALLNRAAVMVYAPRLEPFGLAPIEAAACALPVVAVAEGGVRETVIDGRHTTTPRPKGRGITMQSQLRRTQRRLVCAAHGSTDTRTAQIAATLALEQGKLREFNSF